MGKLLGDYLRSRRLALHKASAGYSIRQLASRLRIHHSYLSKIERGEPASLSEAKTVALAQGAGRGPGRAPGADGKDIQRRAAHHPGAAEAVQRVSCAG